MNGFNVKFERELSFRFGMRFPGGDESRFASAANAWRADCACSTGGCAAVAIRNRTVGNRIMFMSDSFASCANQGTGYSISIVSFMIA